MRAHFATPRAAGALCASLRCDSVAAQSPSAASARRPPARVRPERGSYLLDVTTIALLLAGGLVAGVVNTLAGGGSLLTVPLLIFLGLPGTIANGTNRVGIVVQNLTAAWRFRAEGVSGFRDAMPVLAASGAGSLIGAYAISQVSSALFERLFGIVMIALLVPMLRGARRSAQRDRAPDAVRPWSGGLRALVFFGIGVYGGALQAGVGIFLLFALSRSGFDLVRANSIKVVVIAALTAVAVPVFVIERQIDWVAASVLIVGFALGGTLGARLAVVGGERLIRPVLALAIVAMAGRMLGLY